MRHYTWSPEKNEQLIRERGISFEEVVFHIEAGDEIDVFEHPNQKRYAGQEISVVIVEGYAYLVPYVESDEVIFLKTIIPSRKPQKRMWVNLMSRLDSEEKEILRAFEKGTLKRVKDVDKEIERHRATAAATFKKDSRINIRISSKDLRALQKRALADGIPYQTLVSSVLHKFVEGQLVEHTSRSRRCANAHAA